MQVLIKAVVGLGLIIGMGVVHGRLTDRWGVPQNVVQTAERLQAVPIQIEEWSSTELPISDKQLLAAGAEGYLSRAYQFGGDAPEDGAMTQVMIVCGRPGPIALHEPTVCFVNAGMQQRQTEELTSVTSGSGEHEFMVSDFQEAGLAGTTWRTYWSWSTNSRKWEVPPDPRRAYAGEDYLYKIYFLVPVTDRHGDAPDVHPAAVEFISTFLDVLPLSAAKPIEESTPHQ